MINYTFLIVYQEIIRKAFEYFRWCLIARMSLHVLNMLPISIKILTVVHSGDGISRLLLNITLQQ